MSQIARESSFFLPMAFPFQVSAQVAGPAPFTALSRLSGAPNHLALFEFRGLSLGKWKKTEENFEPEYDGTEYVVDEFPYVEICRGLNIPDHDSGSINDYIQYTLETQKRKVTSVAMFSYVF